MKIRYDAYLRLEPGFTKELCRKLSKSGLKTVLFGFESANQRMLDLMNKGNTPSNMLRVLKNMHNAGIQSILSCLVGFPTETWEEAMDSIRFLKENRAYYYWVYIVHFGMISDMCGHAEDYGVVDMDLNRLVRYDDSGFAALGYPYRTTRGMTVEESLRAIEYGRRELGIRIFPDNFFVRKEAWPLRRWTSVAALVLPLITLMTMVAQAQSDGAVDEPMLEYLDILADTALKKSESPGMAVAIVTPDEVVLRGYGYADREEGAAVDPDTLFELGSMSKAFTGLAILLLEQEGKLNLSDDIRTYLPWLAMRYQGTYRGEEINGEVPLTISNFLYQTSGVPFETIGDIPPGGLG